MGLDSLLATLKKRNSVTPVTPAEAAGVTGEGPSLWAVTPVTPVTPEKTTTATEYIKAHPETDEAGREPVEVSFCPEATHAFVLEQYPDAPTVEPINPAPGEKVTVTDFQAQEDIIGSGLAAYHAAGRALREVRNEGLYKESYANFDEYCKKQWGWNRVYVRQIIEDAWEADNLKDAASGTVSGIPGEVSQ